MKRQIADSALPPGGTRESDALTFCVCALDSGSSARSGVLLQVMVKGGVVRSLLAITAVTAGCSSNGHDVKTSGRSVDYGQQYESDARPIRIADDQLSQIRGIAGLSLPGGALLEGPPHFRRRASGRALADQRRVRHPEAGGHLQAGGHPAARWTNRQQWFAD